MLEWHWPWAVLLPVLAWFLPRWLPPAPPSGQGLWVPFFDEAEEEPASSGKTRASRRFLLLLLGGLLVAAAARPVWVTPATASVPISGRDLVVAFDISVSMLIRDMEMNGEAITRLDVSRKALDAFIAGRSGDRISLLVFGGRAFPLVPLTHDHDGLRAMLAQADVGLAGSTTAISATVALAAERAGETGADDPVLLLFTDGANTAPGIPMGVAVKRAVESGLRIHTIGISTLAGQNNGEDFFRDPMRDLDEALLRSVADATGGRYFPAHSPAALKALLATIDEMEPVESRGRLRETRELYPWPLGAALLLGLVWMAFANGGRETRP